jgi:hypothetical protein
MAIVISLSAITWAPLDINSGYGQTRSPQLARIA